ncbi:MAG TPA: SDR family oxidoreductase [Gemmatimonadales bacterium]|nr:SDR family oxidoreductase [Gemmatimonadales bacterium]
MELAGKVALVTGAGHRVGRALALALAGRGAHLAVHYNSSAAEAEETQRLAHARGVKAELFPADLSDAAAAKALPGNVARQLGRLDILVNCAAIMVRAPIEATTVEQWDTIFDLNLRSYFFVAQGAIPHLRPVKGKIINLADVGGMEPWPKYAAHSISKAGVVMLTRVLALGLAPDITVNAISPGAVLPPDNWDAASREHLVQTTPLKRLGSADDVAGAMLYLLDADYVTGDVLVVDGGRLIR